MTLRFLKERYSVNSKDLNQITYSTFWNLKEIVKKKKRKKEIV